MSDKSSMVTLRTFFMVAFMFLQPSAKNPKYATAFKLFVAKSFRLILPHALNDLISGAIIMQSVLFLTCSFKLFVCLFSFIIGRECCVVMIFFLYILSVIKKTEPANLYRYLQWLIEDQGCNDPHYHTSYALSLAKSAIEAVHMESKYRAKGDREIDPDAQFIYLLREKLQLFLQASDLYDPEDVLDVIAESELWLEKVML